MHPVNDEDFLCSVQECTFMALNAVVAPSFQTLTRDPVLDSSKEFILVCLIWLLSLVLYDAMYGSDCYSPVVDAALPYWPPA